MTDRARLWIQNRSNSTIAIGDSGVTMSTGIIIEALSLGIFDFGPGIELYAIGSGAGLDIRILEEASS